MALRISLFLMTLIVLMITRQVFWRLSLSWDLYSVFLMMDCGYGFQEEDPKHIVPFSLHHIKGTEYKPDLYLLILILITWLNLCLSNFSTVATFHPISRSYAFEGRHYAGPKLDGRKSACTGNTLRVE
jgi:hypothetical protein